MYNMYIIYMCQKIVHVDFYNLGTYVWRFYLQFNLYTKTNKQKGSKLVIVWLGWEYQNFMDHKCIIITFTIAI